MTTSITLSDLNNHIIEVTKSLYMPINAPVIKQIWDYTPDSNGVVTPPPILNY